MVPPTMLGILVLACMVASSGAAQLNWAVANESVLSQSPGYDVVHPDTNDSSHSSNRTGEHHEVHGIHVASINFEHVKAPLVFTIVVLIAAFSKLGFHHADFLSSHVPESCLLIILGTILGAIIYSTGLDGSLPTFFSPTQFFIYLLPPIILEAAFSLHDRVFAENLGSVLIFAVIGTILSCFFIGLTMFGLFLSGVLGNISISFVQLLVFSSLIVAVDPVAVLAVFQEVGVNQVLYFLVFGESLLNDGVTIVLYNVMQTYNLMDVITADQIALGIVKFFVVCFGGLLIGILMGILSAIVTKYTSSVKVVEPIAIFGIAYLSYLLAELFHWSGIISIIGCGLMQVEYAFQNIAKKSKTAIKYFTKVISTSNEILIFLFLGLALVRHEHEWKTGFTLLTILWCVVFRFIIIYCISLLINRFDKYRVRKIGLDEMFIISYGGLRGAVCFSLVALLDEKQFPAKNMFVTTTLAVIIFTVFIQGITIKPLVRLLRVRLASTTGELKMYEELNTHITDHMMAGVEEIIGCQGKFYWKEKLSHLDNKIFRKLLVKDPNQAAYGDITRYYEKLVMREHYRNLQLCNAAKLPKVCVDDLYKDEEEEDEPLLKNERENDVPHEIRKSLLRHSHRHEDYNPEPTPHDLRKFLHRGASQRLLLHAKYDPDLSRERITSFRQQIDDKRQHNLRLRRYRSTQRMPERALSWSDDQAEVTMRRGNDMSTHMLPGRAKTLDLSQSPPKRLTPFVPSLNVRDTVFEENETSIEADPLLDEKEEGKDTTNQLQLPKPQSGQMKHLGRQNAVTQEDIPLKPLSRSGSQ
ncbi:hypothetical protein ScPMuIL_018069 [Solemya velum]